MEVIFEKGIIVAYNLRKKWGFIEKEDGTSRFFHATNSPGFEPKLGMLVRFELAAPFKLGQKDQAINLREVTNAAAQAAQKVSGGAGA